MRNPLILAALAVVVPLAGCSAYKAPSPIPEQATLQPVSEESSSVEDWKEVTLVDQDYTGVSSLNGMDWLHAVHAALVVGNVTDAEMVFTLARGDSTTSWSAVGMYVANVGVTENGNRYPDEKEFGTRMYFVDAEWRGDCVRHLSPTSSFGVLKGHESTLTISDLHSFPVTNGTDGCKTGQQQIDLLSKIRDGGVYLGFAPSDKQTAPFLKVVLRYKGDVAVKPL